MAHETTTADPVLPDVEMNLVPPKAPVIGRVVSNNMCLKGKSNAFVRHTEIDVTGAGFAQHTRQPASACRSEGYFLIRRCEALAAGSRT